MAARGDYFAGQSFLIYFERYLALFAAIQNVYLYTPQFLAKLLRTFCETLGGLHCNEITCLSWTDSLHVSATSSDLLRKSQWLIISLKKTQDSAPSFLCNSHVYKKLHLPETNRHSVYILCGPPNYSKLFHGQWKKHKWSKSLQTPRVRFESNKQTAVIPVYNQKYATLPDLLISTDALHFSGGSSARHQEHITVHTSTIAASSSIGWQYLKLYVQVCTLDDGRRNRLKHVEHL